MPSSVVRRCCCDEFDQAVAPRVRGGRRRSADARIRCTVAARSLPATASRPRRPRHPQPRLPSYHRRSRPPLLRPPSSPTRPLPPRTSPPHPPCPPPLPSPPLRPHRAQRGPQPRPWPPARAVCSSRRSARAAPLRGPPGRPRRRRQRRRCLRRCRTPPASVQSAAESMIAEAEQRRREREGTVRPNAITSTSSFSSTPNPLTPAHNGSLRPLAMPDAVTRGDSAASGAATAAPSAPVVLPYQDYTQVGRRADDGLRGRLGQPRRRARGEAGHEDRVRVLLPGRGQRGHQTRPCSRSRWRPSAPCSTRCPCPSTTAAAAANSAGGLQRVHPAHRLGLLHPRRQEHRHRHAGHDVVSAVPGAAVLPLRSG